MVIKLVTRNVHRKNKQKDNNKKNTVKRSISMKTVIIAVGEGIRVKMVMLGKIRKKEIKRQRMLLMTVVMMSGCYVQ